ncbi:MAG: histidine kinase [Chitinophagaceae bacterium]
MAITLSLMMATQNRIFVWDKYAKLEIAFFVFMCFVIPMMSDLEYGLYEYPKDLERDRYLANLVRRIVWGFFSIVPYYLFYKLAIQQLLIRKKYLKFLLALILFFGLLQLYYHFFEYPLIAKATFLPAEMVKQAARLSHSWQMHFTVHYAILEILQIAAMAYFINYDKQYKQLQALRQVQTETELQQLKAQLQPHFFFNTLNNIYSLALEQSQQTAPMVSKLSTMMRYVLYETEIPKQLLTNEVDFIGNYIDIQSVRYNQKISILFDTQGIDETARIEPLLLLPFIENAFKHGIEEETGTGFIEIIVCLNDDELTLSVKNSKPVKKQTGKQQAGIGMAATQKRLALLYPDKHTLKVAEEDRSYSVLLTITLS